MTDLALDPAAVLPGDGCAGTLVGRAALPAGPTLVAVRDDGVFDLGALAPTSAALMELDDPAAAVAAHAGVRVGALGEMLDAGHLLAPVDLQAIKAAGVTFVASMLERVIEERAGGDPGAAERIRTAIGEEVGQGVEHVRPGSEEAERLKQSLIGRDLWSQYLEVGIGPYAEVFTKAQPMSAVGAGAEIGLHPESGWNNPEPEVVLVVNSRGQIVGATLGNDVNLRDFEGRSALLLGKAKDNNGSAAIGPFVRLFDATYRLEDVRNATVTLHIDGPDGFTLDGASSLTQISRDPADLVAQTLGRHHQYPDGLALYTGTMFAPVDDRDTPGQGFTHKVGDVVTIASPKLGALTNRVGLSTEIPPWTFGTGALMRNLAARGLL